MVRVGRRTELADLRRLTTGDGCMSTAVDFVVAPDDIRLMVARPVSVANLMSVARVIIEAQTSEWEPEGAKEFRETFEKCID